MIRWLLAIGSSTVFAVGGWVAGQAEMGPPPGMDPGHHPKHPPGEHRSMELESITGIVASQTTAPGGMVDGAKLEDGTWLHWPPHLEKYLVKLSAKGEEVTAEGRRQIGPHGEPVLEVSVLTNVGDQATFQRELPPPPPAGRPDGRPCPPPPPAWHPGGPGPQVGMHPPGPGRPGHPGPPPPPPHAAGPPQGPQPPNEHRPTDDRVRQLEDRLQRIEEQLGRLIDRAS